MKLPETVKGRALFATAVGTIVVAVLLFALVLATTGVLSKALFAAAIIIVDVAIVALIVAILIPGMGKLIEWIFAGKS